MTALPRLRIQTWHSEYLIDQNQGTFSRHPVHSRASDFSDFGIGDAEVLGYEDILSPLEVGSRLHITTEDSWVLSTPIVSIEELPAT